MIRIKTSSWAFAPATLLLALCLISGMTWASGDETWPVETDLMIKDQLAASPDASLAIGKVSFFNTKFVDTKDELIHDQLTINVEPAEGYMIGDVNVHLVDDPVDFEALLDRKTGLPKLGKFDFKTDYLVDEGAPATSHQQSFNLDDFDLCWGVNAPKCSTVVYALVAVVLVEEVALDDGTTTWVALPDNAYASNGFMFDRFDKTEEYAWGWYVTYPMAKAMAGQFIDAVVHGLEFATVTQAGTTGENGNFWFLPGERIGFNLGNLFIGDTWAGRKVAPSDLFGGADMDDNRVLNLARLLQSLDSDGKAAQGTINISEPVIACLNVALADLATIPEPEDFFSDGALVEEIIQATIAACTGEVALTAVSKEQALENMNSGLKAGNLVRRNVSKTPELANDKAKIEIMPVYVPAQRPDGTSTEVVYYDEVGDVIETRNVAKPIVVTYLGEDEDSGVYDVYVAISRDDGDSWSRRNISRTAGKSSLIGYPGKSEKPMLKVKDNMIFVAWTDKYCNGGRPGYSIQVCDAFDYDSDLDGEFDTCMICRETHEGTVCTPDYTGDDAYWKDDLFGVAGPQRSVIHEDLPEVGEVPYSCVWTARGVVEASGDVQWFKPERVTSGRRDAYQLFAGAGEDVAFGIVWQEDPKGLMPGEGHGPGDGWSGANTHSKTDIWYSYITMADFAKADANYPTGGHGDNNDLVDSDPVLQGRVKALVPMSLPVRISDNDVCSLENILAVGGDGEHDDGEEHDFDHDGQGTHRYCGSVDEDGNLVPGPLCAYTLPKENPQGVVHNVCVTEDGRFLDGNTGASRANLFLQPFCKKKDSSGNCLEKSAWAIIGYEESKGVGTPPEDEDGCGDEDVALVTETEGEEDDHEDRYKPDSGKNVIYHSFRFDQPDAVSSGGILNLPERDAQGNLVYLTEDPELYAPDPPPLMLDWKDDPILAYENARRIRFVTQPKSKMGESGTVLVALYRQGEEGGGKPADIFMRRISLPEGDTGNPYAFSKFASGAQNVSSVKPTKLWQNPLDPEAPVKMMRWAWTEDNLADSSAKNPYTDARAHRGALNGDDLIIGYIWNPNWGRKANGKYDFYVRRSFDGGKHWTTDPDSLDPIAHHVVFRDPVLDEDGLPILDPDNGSLIWEDVVITTIYDPDESEPPRNVSNLRNNRVSVLEPRIVKTPGTIKGTIYAEDKQDTSVYQLAYGLEFNQDSLPEGVTYPKTPLDIYYSRTMDKGQHYQSVVVTPQSGSGRPEEGWNPLTNKEAPDEEGAVQMRQTPDGSRMYGIWLEHGQHGTDIMFRRVDYRGAQ